MSGIRWLRAGLDTCCGLLLYPTFGFTTSSTRGVRHSQCGKPDATHGSGPCRVSFHTAAAASLILLSACASKPAIEVRTVRVEVPVPVACVAAADVPQRPGPLPPRPEDARQALDQAMAKLLEYFGYADKADAVLRGCVE